MDTVVRTGQDGLLDVTVSSLGLRKDITPDVVMGCEVTIDNTDFYVREELELFEYPSKSLTFFCRSIFKLLFLFTGLKSRYTSSSSQILVSLPFYLSLSITFFAGRTN